MIGHKMSARMYMYICIYVFISLFIYEMPRHPPHVCYTTMYIYCCSVLDVLGFGDRLAQEVAAVGIA